MFVLQLATLVLVIATLVLAVLVYLKTNKKEGYHDSAYQYLNAYNDVYSPPRPSFYDRCSEYNEWAEEANKMGKQIVSDCNKKFPNDPNCPQYLPWAPAPCTI